MKKILATLSGFTAALVLAATPLASAATTNVITPANMQGWGFAQENPLNVGQTGQITLGPSNPPTGEGSAELSVGSTGGMVIGKLGYSGLKLADINKLEYSTYRASGAPALAIALQFTIDNDVTDNDNTFKGRLVYEPYHTQSVSSLTWQDWNTLDNGAGTGSGNWFFTNGTLSSFSGCTMANPCTMDEVLVKYPNAGIHNILGSVFLKAGGGWTGGFTGNVDNLIINDDIYDFELTNIPNDKDNCKKDGFKNYTDPSGTAFKNQGQCVAFVASKGKVVGNYAQLQF